LSRREGVNILPSRSHSPLVMVILHATLCHRIDMPTNYGYIILFLLYKLNMYLIVFLSQSICMMVSRMKWEGF
jgi:hypothetical protein